jgi:hypothetical protein
MGANRTRDRPCSSPCSGAAAGARHASQFLKGQLCRLIGGKFSGVRADLPVFFPSFSARRGVCQAKLQLATWRSAAELSHRAPTIRGPLSGLFPSP